jgi:hypothetical protein
MLRTLDTHRQFEALARSFLAEHPTIRHEWRHVRNAWGGRTDLICEPGTANEVFASLTSGQITVGARGSDTDFEDFGRNLSDDQIAREAFGQFLKLLSESGIVSEGHDA